MSKRLFSPAKTIDEGVRNITHAIQLGYSEGSVELTILKLDLIKLKGGTQKLKEILTTSN